MGSARPTDATDESHLYRRRRTPIGPYAKYDRAATACERAWADDAIRGDVMWWLVNRPGEECIRFEVAERFGSRTATFRRKPVSIDGHFATAVYDPVSGTIFAAKELGA